MPRGADNNPGRGTGGGRECRHRRPCAQPPQRRAGRDRQAGRGGRRQAGLSAGSPGGAAGAGARLSLLFHPSHRHQHLHADPAGRGGGDGRASFGRAGVHCCAPRRCLRCHGPGRRAGKPGRRFRRCRRGRPRPPGGARSHQRPGRCGGQGGHPGVRRAGLQAGALRRHRQHGRGAHRGHAARALHRPARRQGGADRRLPGPARPRRTAVRFRAGDGTGPIWRCCRCARAATTTRRFRQ